MPPKIFSPKVYIKAGAGVTVATTYQDDLDAVLVSDWTLLDGSVEGSLEESFEGASKLSSGQTLFTMKITTGKVKNLETAVANFQHLKTTHENILSTILFNEKNIVAGTGRLVQVSNVYITIDFSHKTNEAAFFEIGFKHTSGRDTTKMEVARLLATDPS